MSTRFDAIIIGTGQAGPALAARLSATGMRVAIIERKLFGGTCVNTGCIPTKTLVASAYAAHLVCRAAKYGVTVGGPISVDMKRVKARKDEISGVPTRTSKSGCAAWKTVPCTRVMRASKVLIRSESMVICWRATRSLSTWVDER